MEKIKLTWLLVSVLLSFFLLGVALGYSTKQDTVFWQGVEYGKNLSVCSWVIP